MSSLTSPSGERNSFVKDEGPSWSDDLDRKLTLVTKPDGIDVSFGYGAVVGTLRRTSNQLPACGEGRLRAPSAAMHRPTRQHQHLTAKVEAKKTRSQSQKKKPGRKAKQWSKWLAQYAPLVAGAAPAADTDAAAA